MKVLSVASEVFPLVKIAALRPRVEAITLKDKSPVFNTARIDHLYADPHDPNVKLVLHYGDMTDASSAARKTPTKPGMTWGSNSPAIRP